MIGQLLQKGVRIPAPQSVVCEDIDIARIQPGAVLYPGTVLRGRETFIGREACIGLGGGAFVENAQIGAHAQVMQGTYKKCALLDHTVVRNGAEIREGSILEEGAELGHTVGLKQSIFFPEVVAGSLINFCDVLIAGGTSRKDHSEIGSCMALYNYTPQGDKFASIFGDVVHGLFLDQPPVFVGGQTQIVSPVCVGYGAVVAAGSKQTGNLASGRIYGSSGKEFERDFDRSLIWRPDLKVENTRYYIGQLMCYRAWYENVRLPLFAGSEEAPIYEAVLEHIDSGLKERHKRLSAFVNKLPASLEKHRAQGHDREVTAHEHALELAARAVEMPAHFNYSGIVAYLRREMQQGKRYVECMRALPPALRG